MVTPESTKPSTKNQALLNARALAQEFSWFTQVMDTRFKLYFGNESNFSSIYEVPVPDLSEDASIYASIVRHYKMSVQERLILLLALAPHVCPQALDMFFVQNKNYSRGFSEFGGIKGTQHGGFLPTGETAAFLLAGTDLTQRFQIMHCFDPEHFFNKFKILTLETSRSSEPLLSGPLTISREYFFFLTNGHEYKPTFSQEFPAQRISTKLDWEDLVIEPHILDEIMEIWNWIKNQRLIMEEWGLQKLLKPGYRALFYGPPGTGKTLTASLLGKSADLDVYRVDLSKVVSKYIGETEKNLAHVFDQAENKNWILFFDEADALFGKRTSNSDAKDRYANQEVAYLLQRIEDFPGIVILATNLKTNIDEAFARRFQSIIYFPMPHAEQRLQLWRHSFQHLPLGESVDLSLLAERFELTGGAIINILRYCALAAVERNPPVIQQADILTGIRKELRKEGKTI